MPHQCPRCQRTLPDRAAYCAFDGTMLRNGSAMQASGGALLQEFYFPSGRRCRTFDELAQGCNAEWEEARLLLKDGTFASYLAGIGRADLARLAREAQALADPDMGLANFVTGLPGSAAEGPKLGLSPRRLVVGPIHVGEQRPIQITVQNEGRGLLQGTLSVAEGEEWLQIVQGEGPRQTTIKANRDQVVRLLVNTQALNANQNYSGKLVAVTNGGAAELPIRLDLVCRPFARAPYAGAATPRDLARKFRDNPKPAVELFQNGEIARWFASNGWAYPIIGAPAPGLAAVQQYFEELGLARAPQVELGSKEVRLNARAGERCQFQITIRSPARKLVYARAECSVPWLRLAEPNVAGQGQTAFDVEVDTTQLVEDRDYPAMVKVVANAGQSFFVQVRISMSGNQRSWFAPPVVPPPVPTATAAPVAAVPVYAVPTYAAAPAKPASATVPSEEGYGLFRALVVGAMLGLLWRLLLVFPADVYARMLAAPPALPAAGTLEAWLIAPSADQGPFLRLFVLATWWVGALAGAVISWRKGGTALDLLCGLIAGAVAGLAGSATVGCLLVMGDEVPRLLLAGVKGQAMGAAVATTLWLVLAVVSWAVNGAALGVGLYMLGEFGQAVLGVMAAPFTSVLRFLGCEGLARPLEP